MAVAQQENPLVEGLERLPIHPTTMVIFGGTGDLCYRKLLPAIYNLAHEGALPERFNLIAVSRSDIPHDDYRNMMRESIQKYSRRKPDDQVLEKLLAQVRYVPGVFDDDSVYERLDMQIKEFDTEAGIPFNRLFYLSTSPAFFALIVGKLGDHALNKHVHSEVRVVIEKPFGTRLSEALELNREVLSVLDESQVFRIDHYLGKETVQNILAARFGNGVFESIWNREHIDHVQIDVPETLSIGSRAGFYESTGAFRDMIVTHLLQVVGFVAMEPPVSFSPKALVDETVKVFDSIAPLRPEDMIRGQYAGYRDEEGVAPDSDTETFVALKVAIENWRWAGVPFYLRTGKRMAEGRRLITITFREPPRRMFEIDQGYQPNEIVFDLADRGGISASFLAKVPGPTMHLGRARMRFDYDDSFAGEHELDAYERLIHDALLGDRTLFTCADGIERLWEVSAPILDAPPPLRIYEPGSWGPAGTDELIAPGRWHLPEPS